MQVPTRRILRNGVATGNRPLGRIYGIVGDAVDVGICDTTSFSMALNLHFLDSVYRVKMEERKMQCSVGV